jgi:hypothetical protein
MPSFDGMLSSMDDREQFNRLTAELVDLEDQVAVTSDWQKTQPWVKDRIKRITEIREEINRIWPIEPGRSQPE